MLSILSRQSYLISLIKTVLSYQSYQDNTLTFKSSNQSSIPTSPSSSQAPTRIQGTEPSSNDRISDRQRLLSRGSVRYWEISWVLIAISDLIQRLVLKRTAPRTGGDQAAPQLTHVSPAVSYRFRHHDMTIRILLEN